MIHQATDLNIYLIRHAEATANTHNDLIIGRSKSSRLTLNGKKQAVLLGKSFSYQKISFDKIYTSPLIRSLETCRLVCKELQVSPQKVIQAQSLEEFTPGKWEGKKRKKIYTTKILSYMNTKGPFFIPPEGESQIDVEYRVSGWFLKEILRNENYLAGTKNIAIFSHGLTIKCLLHFIMNFDDRLIYRIQLDNSSVSKIRFNKDGFFIDTINNTVHLGVDTHA